MFPSIEGSAGQWCSPLQDTENTYGTAERVLLGTEKKETRITHCYITRLAPPFQSGSVVLLVSEPGKNDGASLCFRPLGLYSKARI